MSNSLKPILRLFDAEAYTVSQVPEHEGGRNQILVIENAEGVKRILRISTHEDRTEELDYEDIEDAAECLIQNIPYAGLMGSSTGCYD